MQKFKTLADAIALAEFAHRNQEDKAGMPYITHPMRVMQAVQAQGAQPYVQMAAVLHDVTEDTAFTCDTLAQLGFAESVVEIVRLMDRDASRKRYEDIDEFRTRYDLMEDKSLNPYQWFNYDNLLFGATTADDFYYMALRGNPGALMVKLADIGDNTQPYRLLYLPQHTQARLTKKYQKALDILNG